MQHNPTAHGLWSHNAVLCEVFGCIFRQFSTGILGAIAVFGEKAACRIIRWLEPMKNLKNQNFDTYRRMWGLTGSVCYLIGIFSLAEYLIAGKIKSPKGPFTYEGTEALFFLLFFWGAAIFSTMFCIYFSRKIKRKGQALTKQ